MCVVVHRIDAPLAACTVMVSVDNTVHERVTEKHIRMRHVDLRTKHLLALCVLSVTHSAEKLEVLLYASVAVWALGTWYLNCTTACTDLLLCLVIYICQALLDQFLSPLVELIEIIRCISFVLPLETEPLDILLDRVYILCILLYRIRIIETEICLSALFLCKAEVYADTLSMSDVKVSVWLRRETCHDRVTLSAGKISLDNFFKEIESFSLVKFFIYLFHIFGNIEFAKNRAKIAIFSVQPNSNFRYFLRFQSWSAPDSSKAQ